MDIGIHWCLLRHLKREVDAKPSGLITAMVLDALLLGVFLWVKVRQEPMILACAAGGVAAIFLLEWQFLRVHRFSDGEDPNYRSPARTDGRDDDSSRGPGG